MALIKCPECGKDISDRAIQCPGCGHYVVNANKDISNNNNDIDVQVIETNSNSKGLQVFSDEKSISIKISITTLIAICVAVISVILMVVSFVYIGGYKKESHYVALFYILNHVFKNPGFRVLQEIGVVYYDYSE